MSNYRRFYCPGGTYFLTVVPYQRQPLFTDPNHVELLRYAFRYAKARRPFQVVAIVVLPDHLHCLWQLPDGDSDFSNRWRIIKTAFSRYIPTSLQHDGSKTVWQPRYWDHLIRDEDDFRRHLDYIHYNPVKHGLVAVPLEWPFSSFPRFVKEGWYDQAWGTKEPDDLVGLEYE